MKRKTITLVVYMLVCISLVSVGFAAWVITGGDTKEVKGNVTATSVTDESVSIENGRWQNGANEQIVFGTPETIDYGWLQTTATTDKRYAIYLFELTTKDGNIGTAVEKLGDVTLKVNNLVNSQTQTSVIAQLQAANMISEPIIRFALSTSEFGGTINNSAWTLYEDTMNEGVSSTSFKDKLTDGTYDNNIKKVYVAVKIEYNWGTFFGGSESNPYKFYSTKDPSAASDVKNEETTEDQNDYYTWKQHAYKYLTYLNTQLASSNEEYQLVITLALATKASN